MSDDLYKSAGGSLKLKSCSSSKKKHKKSKKRKVEEEEERTESPVPSRDKKARNKTPAQIAFEEAKKQKQDKEMLKKAQKTHKERIMEFNQSLDSLSEHYDIPKVSWTK